MPNIPQKPMTYREILNLYNTRKAEAPETFATMSLPEFSTKANELTGTNYFNEGAHATGVGGLIRRGVAAKDDFLDWTGLPNLIGNGVAGAASGLGLPEAYVNKAREVGSDFPNMAVNMLPLALGGLPGLAGMAGLAGLDTYGKSGSIGQAALSAGTMAVMPAAAKAGGQYALSKLGVPLVEEGLGALTGQRVARGLGESVAQAAGSQAGALGAMQASRQIGNMASGNGLDFNPVDLFGDALGAVPFAGLDVMHSRDARVKLNDARAAAETARMSEANAAKPVADNREDFELYKQELRDLQNSQSFTLHDLVIPENSNPLLRAINENTGVNKRVVSEPYQPVSAVEANRQRFNESTLGDQQAGLRDQLSAEQEANKGLTVQDSFIRRDLPIELSFADELNKQFGISRRVDLTSEKTVPMDAADAAAQKLLGGLDVMAKDIPINRPKVEAQHTPEDVIVALNNGSGANDAHTYQKYLEELRAAKQGDGTVVAKSPEDLAVEARNSQIEKNTAMASEKIVETVPQSVGKDKYGVQQVFPERQVTMADRVNKAIAEAATRFPDGDASEVWANLHKFNPKKGKLGGWVSKVMKNTHNKARQSNGIRGRRYSIINDVPKGYAEQVAAKARLENPNDNIGVEEISKGSGRYRVRGETNDTIAYTDDVANKVSVESKEISEIDAENSTAGEVVRDITHENISKFISDVFERVVNSVAPKSPEMADRFSQVFAALAEDMSQVKMRDGKLKITLDPARAESLGYATKNGLRKFEREVLNPSLNTVAEKVYAEQKALNGERPKVFQRKASAWAGPVSVRAWARRFFGKLAGYSRAAAESSAAMAERVESLVRQDLVFPSNDQVRMTDLQGKPNELGAALVSMDPTWSGIVGLATKFFGVRDAEVFFKGVLMNHENFHNQVSMMKKKGFLNPVQTESIQQMLDLAAKLNESERGMILRGALQSALPKATYERIMADPEASKEFFGTLEDYSKSEPEEFVSTLAGIFGTCMSVDRTAMAEVKANLPYMDAEVYAFAQGQFKSVGDLINAITGFWKANELGLIGEGRLTSPASIQQVMNAYAKRFATLSRTPEQVTEAIRVLDHLASNSSDFVMESLLNQNLPPITDIGIEGVSEELTRLNGLWGKTGEKDSMSPLGQIFPFYHIVEFHPQLADIGRIGASAPARAHAISAQLIEPLVGKEARTTTEKVVNSSKLSKVLTTHLLQEQMEDRFLSPQEVQKINDKAGLSKEEGKMVASVRSNIVRSMKASASAQLTNARDTFTSMTKQLLMAYDKTMKYATASDMAEQATNELFNSKALTIQTLPEGISAVLDAFTAFKPSYDTLAQTLNKPWYVPMLRNGKYNIAYKTASGERGMEAADTYAKATEIQARLEKAGNTVKLYTTGDDARTAGMNGEVLNALFNIESQQLDVALKNVTDPAEREAVKRQYSPGAALIKEQSIRNLNRTHQHRIMAKGAETLDLVQGVLDYLSVMPQTLAKDYIKRHSQAMLNDPELLASPSVRETGRQAIDNILARTSKMENSLTKAVAHYFLGANLSSAMLTSLEHVSVIPSQLLRDGASYKQAFYDFTVGASKLMLETLTHNGQITSNKAVNELYQRAVKEGAIGHGITEIMDLDGLHEGGSLYSVMKGTPLESVAAMARKPWNHMVKLNMAIFTNTAGFSNKMAFVSGVLHGLSKGLTPDAAYEKGLRLVHLSANGGGKMGRSVAGFNGKWLPRSVVGVLSTMQHYTMNQIASSVRLGYDAIGNAKLSPSEKVSARKAFLALATTQVAMAGVLGLPAAGATLGIIQQLFPDTKLKQRLREGIASLASDPDDNGTGAMLADFFMKGAPTAMFGVDVSNRLGVGDIFGMNDQQGFTLKGLLGAPGSIAANLIKGVQDTTTGNFGQAAQDVAPVALKKLIALYRNDGEFKDNRGQLLVKGTDGDRVKYALGFTPNSVSRVRDQQELMFQADKANKMELQRFNGEQAAQLAAGNYAAVREAVLQRAAENPTSYSAAEGLNQIVSLVQERTQPVDLRRAGNLTNAQDFYSISKTFAQKGEPIDEVAKLRERQQIQQGLGVVGRIAPTSIMKSALVARIMKNNPNISLEQARFSVDQSMMHRPNMGVGRQVVPTDW